MKKKRKAKGEVSASSAGSSQPSLVEASDAPKNTSPSESESVPDGVRALLLRGGTEEALIAAVRWVAAHLETFPVPRSEIEALRADIVTLETLDTSPRIRKAGMRAFVLLSLYLEEATALAIASVSEEDARYVHDMRTRVLPVLVPLYIDHLAQRPDVFVGLASCMHRLWPGEPMQNLHSGWCSVPLLAL